MFWGAFIMVPKLERDLLSQCLSFLVDEMGLLTRTAESGRELVKIATLRTVGA